MWMYVRCKHEIDLAGEGGVISSGDIVGQRGKIEEPVRVAVMAYTEIPTSSPATEIDAPFVTISGRPGAVFLLQFAVQESDPCDSLKSSSRFSYRPT